MLGTAWKVEATAVALSDLGVPAEAGWPQCLGPLLTLASIRILEGPWRVGSGRLARMCRSVGNLEAGAVGLIGTFEGSEPGVPAELG